MYINKRLSMYLDLARWIAAGAVVIGHLRSYMFVEYGLVTDRNMFIRLFYFLTGFGHEAVMIFFVLSGFLVGGKVLHRVKKGQFDVRLYAINRVSRLYVVLIGALVIGYILDNIGLNYLNNTGIYNGTYQIELNSPVFSAQANLGLYTLLSNILMFQTILTPPLGTNQPLWSLSNEFWYYVLFPIIVIMLIGSSGLKKKGLLAVLLLVLVLFLPFQMLLYFSMWVMGALVSLLERPIVKYFFVSIGSFGFSLLMARVGVLPAFASDMLVASAFALTINTLIADRHEIRPVVATFNAKMSGFSYSLYSIHYPVMVFILSWISVNVSDVFVRQPSLKLFVSYCGLVLVLYLAWRDSRMPPVSWLLRRFGRWSNRS